LNAETKISADSQPTPKTMLTINFGVEGNCEESVAGGWSSPERGFRWMTGVESELRLDQRFVDGDYIIELDLIPFVRPPKLPTQRLNVSVNGIVVGESTLAQSGRFGYRIPAAALAGRHITSVVLTHPDAGRPSDFPPGEDSRLLSVAAARLRMSRVRHGASRQQINGTGGVSRSELVRVVNMSAERFMFNFESLGENCEFGLVQRFCGTEPFLSLLRFASMGLPTLLRALDAGFQDFSDDANIELHPEGTGRVELAIFEKHYGVAFHTFRYQGEIDEEQLRASEAKRLAYCARLLVRDLKRGNKIFVVKRNAALREEEILPLYAALSSYGRNNVLWVVPADAEHASGSVEVVLPGLFKGYIDRFAPIEDAYDLSLDAWLEVCVNAYQLSLADRMAARMGEESSAWQVPAPPPAPVNSSGVG